MQPRVYNFSRSNRLKGRSFSLIGVLWLSFLALPYPARAENIPALMKMNGFRTVVYAVARLNFAMQQAAKNPMEQKYRTAVRSAMAALPAAVVALAQEFRSNRLHDADLKPILGVLGGFVDRSAPFRFNQFLKNPSVSQIPKLGDNFPKISPAAVGAANSSQSLFMDEGAAKRGSVNPTSVNNLSTAALTPSEIANLSDAQLNPSPSGSGSASPSLIIDEDASTNGAAAIVEASSTNGLGKQIKGTPVDAGVNGSGAAGPLYSLEQANADLNEVEKALVTSSASKTESEDDFFRGPTSEAKQKPKKNRKAHGLGQQKKKGSLETFQLSLTPKYWKVVSSEVLHALFPLQVARAQGGEGEGEESGQKGADILFGIAAILAAASPIMAAAITANAQEQQAQIAANEQVTVAQMNANTQMQLSQMQQQAMKANMDNAATMNQANIAAAKQRIDIQVQQAERQTSLQYALQQEKDAVAQQAQNNAMMLSQVKLTNDQQLALAQSSAQYEAAGVIGAGVNTNSNNLAMTFPGGATVGLGKRGPSFGSVLSGGGAGATLAQNGGGAGAPGGAGGANAGAGGNGAVLASSTDKKLNEKMGEKKQASAGSGRTNQAAALRLLASLTEGKSTAPHASRATLFMASPTTYVRGVSVLNMTPPKTLASLMGMQHLLQRGSMPGALVRISEKEPMPWVPMDSLPGTASSIARSKATRPLSSRLQETNFVGVTPSPPVPAGPLSFAAPSDFNPISGRHRGAPTVQEGGSGPYNAPSVEIRDPNAGRVFPPFLRPPGR